MRVFLSFSGDRSLAVAQALYDWLPSVIQAVKPWMSAKDIDKGSRWSNEIAAQLDSISMGIVCLTSDSRESRWLHFEAGALSKAGTAAQTTEKVYVCTYLLDVEPSQVEQPLAQFNATRATREDTRKLVHTINSALGSSALSPNRVDEQFDLVWPKLEQTLNNIPPNSVPTPQRPERGILEEILSTVRTLARPKQRISPENPRGHVPETFRKLVEERSPLVASLLKNARLLSTDSKNIVLGFAKEDRFSFEMLQQEENSKLLQEIAETALGKSVKIGMLRMVDEQ